MSENNRKRMTYEQQRALRQRAAQSRLSDSPYSTNSGRLNSASLSGDLSSSTRRPSVSRSSRAERELVDGSRSDDRSSRSSRSRSNDRSSRSNRSASSRSRSEERTSRERRSSRQARSSWAPYSERAERTAERTQASRRTERGTSTRSSSRQRSSQQPDNALRNLAAAPAVKRIPVMRIAIIAGVAIALFLILNLVSSIMPINVTINGTEHSLRGAKTLQTAAKESGLPLNPGDLISLQGNVLKRNEGEQFSAVVNGEKVTDLDTRLHDGDKVDLSDGEDIVEPYEAVQQVIPRSARIAGVGALHVVDSQGTDGTLEIRTGSLSGEVVEKQTVAPENATCNRYNADSQGDKVIALTFDDGPSNKHTNEILDILAENDAKATFFCVGTSIELDNNADIVKRAHSEGHLICTHTYDHARAGGSTNIGTLPAEGQVNELVKGRQVITDTLGEEASRIVRLPGGSLDDDILKNLYPYFDVEVGWNIDTADWLQPGVDTIYEAMLMAGPGDIVLCHDGGGDRSQTVEALRKALPELKRQGYQFVTVDELLKYPARSNL